MLIVPLNSAPDPFFKAYYRSFGVPVILTRGNNVFGPRQYPEKVIPKFICSLQRGLPCPIHGDGSTKRSFIYISDMVEAFDVILHKGNIGEVYNIGSNFEISVLEVAKLLLKEFGYTDREDEFLNFVDDRKFNDLRYNINSTKLIELGWTPKTSFEEGIRRTIEWHNQHRDMSLIWKNINMEEVLGPHPQFPIVHTI